MLDGAVKEIQMMHMNLEKKEHLCIYICICAYICVPMSSHTYQKTESERHFKVMLVTTINPKTTLNSLYEEI